MEGVISTCSIDGNDNCVKEQTGHALPTFRMIWYKKKLHNKYTLILRHSR
jgi:hypothetical protein